MAELFPLCRSITGNGVRESLRILQRMHPELTLHEVPSGTRCFDWTVPEEWNIRDAYVKDSKGRRVIDFQKSNLHVLGYSEPFEGKLTLEELKKNLYTLPKIPHAVPYVTSYYAKRWGFCLAHRDLLRLKKGTYEVKIDSEFKQGSLTYGELIISGDTPEEILLSTYLCHPSMANNELSGPVVAAFLANAIKQQKRRRYTYRILFLTETIGSIAYLSKHLVELKRRVAAGYVITCVGTGGPFNYIESRAGNTLTDRVTRHLFENSDAGGKTYPYLERGSDERQFCWPGVDLPVGSLIRKKYGTFPEYHTSLDNLSFVKPRALEESFQMYCKALEILENNHRYQTTVLCEPQLGRRGLYSTLGTSKTPVDGVKIINFLSMCDGFHDVLSIAATLRCPVWELFAIAEKCLEVGLIVPAQNIPLRVAA